VGVVGQRAGQIQVNTRFDYLVTRTRMNVDVKYSFSSRDWKDRQRCGVEGKARKDVQTLIVVENRCATIVPTTRNRARYFERSLT